jgi:uncharacterized OsmC-like protein
MNARELAALQNPLKERYRANPPDALLTLEADGKIKENLCCDVQIGQTVVSAGLHPAAGGKGGTVSPVAILLGSLVSCLGVTMGAVSTYMGIKIRSGSIHAEGDIDLRGTLGVDEFVRVGVETVRLRISLDTDESEEQIRKLLDVVEKYAVVFQTLSPSVKMQVTFAKGVSENKR